MTHVKIEILFLLLVVVLRSLPNKLSIHGVVTEWPSLSLEEEKKIDFLILGQELSPLPPLLVFPPPSLGIVIIAGSESAVHNRTTWGTCMVVDYWVKAGMADTTFVLFVCLLFAATKWKIPARGNAFRSHTGLPDSRSKSLHLSHAAIWVSQSVCRREGGKGRCIVWITAARRWWGMGIDMIGIYHARALAFVVVEKGFGWWNSFCVRCYCTDRIEWIGMKEPGDRIDSYEVCRTHNG
jgi:hypothetical protein